MKYILAVLLPPLAVLMTGKTFKALLNLILTAIFWLPGAIHAVLVVRNSETQTV
ncbi:YqaE/Pmp3 family membrane protein [Thalassobacillus pellis]|uniref:YqaE/Pmp3 family membrane protein n=1 Tax=Thalassobacillus pellis TaxID=748008 RepID=UPI00196162BB